MAMSDHRAFFQGKLFAGPMVKASCLPFRLICLEYGADGVFGPATSGDAIRESHRSDE
jgi:tRNA-dihydrouridine synthase 2